MSITGLDSVVFGVRDMEKSRRFLDDWGLKRVRSGAFGANYECADGSEVQLRPRDNKKLPPAIQAGSTVREVVWGLRRQSQVDAIAAELSRDRDVSVDADGTLHAIDDIGLGIGFRVSRKRSIKAKPASVNVPGKEIRVDTPATFYERAQPQSLSHIVFGVPDFQVVEDFYVGRLGFCPTDRYPGRGVFLRAAPRANHHNLFVMNIQGRRPKFNHLAFKVRDVHEVIGGGQFIQKQGWRTQVGPGRHYISSACFWYFVSPLGGAMEYCADEDLMTEKWRARDFEVGPDIFSEWTFNAGAEFRAPTAASVSRK